MTKTEAIAAFPIGTPVKALGNDGTVTGHPEYIVAFIGRQALVEVTSLNGKVLGDFAPKQLTR